MLTHVSIGMTYQRIAADPDLRQGDVWGVVQGDQSRVMLTKVSIGNSYQRGNSISITELMVTNHPKWDCLV